MEFRRVLFRSAVIARGHTIHAPKQRGPGEGGIARHAGADINGARRRRLGYRIEPAPHRQCPHLGRTGALQPVDMKESLSDASSDRQCTVIAMYHMALVDELALDAAPLVMIGRDTLIVMRVDNRTKETRVGKGEG